MRRPGGAGFVGRVLVVGLLLAGLVWLALPPAGAAAAEDQQCFAETGQCLSGRFLAYWREHGGLAINGYPLTPERDETLEDGKTYRVQYFERVRMEYHPENAGTPYEVLLGQFGREVFRESFQFNLGLYRAAAAPVAAVPGMAYFPTTGHNVAPDFFAYWEANGGLAQFGYPLGEEQDEHLFVSQAAGPQTFRVQYFERGRLERHPENAGTPYAVLLGQFGRQVLAWRDTPLAAPFAALYRGDAALREHVGTPTTDTATPSYDVLYFERGLVMLPETSGPQTGFYFPVLLCGGTTPVNPRTFSPGLTLFVSPGQPLPAGGPGPRPGTYEPGGVLGLLWENWRNCLGYATAPAPAQQAVTYQRFSRGVMYALHERGEIYALYVEATDGTVGYYLRYDLPR